MNLLAWPVILRATPAPGLKSLPPEIVTAGSSFLHEGLPAEVGILLPNTEGNTGLLAAVGAAPGSFARHAVGLFLADPFLNVEGEIPALQGAGIRCIVNLPSVEQQDVDFVHQLEDVGLDLSREIGRLDRFRQAGFQIIAAVAGAEGAAAVCPLDPLALFVVPRVADFAAGFPSSRQRGAAALEVRRAAESAGWSGPVLGLGGQGEADHESLWPEVFDGLVCRPQAITAPRTELI